MSNIEEEPKNSNKINLNEEINIIDNIYNWNINTKSTISAKYPTCRTLQKKEIKMFNHSDLYFTTVTVGKKGQIIITVKLREKMSITPDEQLVILSGSHQDGFAVLKTQSFIERQEKFKELTAKLFGKNVDSKKNKENKE